MSPIKTTRISSIISAAMSLESIILLIKISKERIGDYCPSQNFMSYLKQSKILWRNEKKDKN